MKKLLLFVLCMAYISIRAQGYEYTEPQMTTPTGMSTFLYLYTGKTIPQTTTTTTTTTTDQSDDDWIVSIAVSEDVKHIKIKYKTTITNAICTICGAYIFYSGAWHLTTIYKNEFGYYVYYYSKYYF